MLFQACIFFYEAEEVNWKICPGYFFCLIKDNWALNLKEWQKKKL